MRDPDNKPDKAALGVLVGAVGMLGCLLAVLIWTLAGAI